MNSYDAISEYHLGVAYPFAVLPPSAQQKHLVKLVEVCNSNCGA